MICCRNRISGKMKRRWIVDATPAPRPFPAFTEQTMNRFNSTGCVYPHEQERIDFGHWLAGFTDGEGCFHLSMMGKKRTALPRTRFVICLRDDDRSVLEMIRDRLGCGSVTGHKKFGTSNPSCVYKVTDLDDLMNVIIPFFEEFPLRAKKGKDFQIWKQAVPILHRVKHRKASWIPGWKQGSLPKWTPEELAEASRLREEISSVREYTEDVSVFTMAVGDRREFGNWFAGFVDGEACFDLQASLSDGYLSGICSFRIKLRKDETPILRRIQKFLGAGVITKTKEDGNNPRVLFLITGADNLSRILVPVLEECSLRAKKSRDYEVWKKGISLLCEIRSRPRIGKTDGHGYISKWTDSERKEYADLCREIKEVRRYKGTV